MTTSTHGTASLPPTDLGNAARFVRQFGPDVRFCHAWGRWLIWDGARWSIDDRGEVVKLAKRVALGIFDEAKQEQDPDRQAAIARHAIYSQKRDRLMAMLDLAKCEIPITPAEMDRDPWLLNCLNGTVDLRTGNLRPHRRGDCLTKLCGVEYVPTATAPTFERFLSRIFRSHPGLIGYVQKAFGYACTGLTSEQVLFFLHGGGANGKTTLLDAVQHVLGDYAGKADRDLLTTADGTAHPCNVADLMGRRLVVCAETNEGRQFDEAKLKDIVGETRLKARFMRQDFFEFAATHKVFLYSNHRPVVRGIDLGFWRRMRLIPFVETIDGHERDPDLPAKLQQEAEGILAWIVQGCLRWQQEGLGLPDEVAHATDDYRRDMDTIGAFLHEYCIFGERLMATAKDLYAAYRCWCEDDSGERPISQKRFGAELVKRGLRGDRDSRTGRKIWRGIGLSVEIATSAEPLRPK